MRDSKIKQPLQSSTLRFLSGIVLSVFFLFLTYVDVFLFRFFCSLTASLMLFEWLNITKVKEKRPQLLSFFFLFLVLSALLMDVPEKFIFLLLILGFLICALFPFLQRGLWAASGFLYVGLSTVSLVFLRGKGIEGFYQIVFLVFVVWTTDTCAYYTGRRFGGPKLAVFISPQKTYSGAIGGVVGGVMLASVFGFFFLQESLFFILIKAFFLSLVSQCGDLFESSIKRYHKVKDSGNIIPGHGGVLDRVDSLSAASIVFYFFL